MGRGGGGGGGGGWGGGLVEEKEESETLCLKALILSTLHLDRCNSRGHQHKGAPSTSIEL